MSKAEKSPFKKYRNTTVNLEAWKGMTEAKVKKHFENVPNVNPDQVWKDIEAYKK